SRVAKRSRFHADLPFVWRNASKEIAAPSPRTEQCGDDAGRAGTRKTRLKCLIYKGKKEVETLWEASPPVPPRAGRRPKGKGCVRSRCSTTSCRRWRNRRCEDLPRTRWCRDRQPDPGDIRRSDCAYRTRSSRRSADSICCLLLSASATCSSCPTH